MPNARGDRPARGMGAIVAVWVVPCDAREYRCALGVPHIIAEAGGARSGGAV